MKSILLLLVVLLMVNPLVAQWSNINNTFTNDFHMVVSNATGDQSNAIVIASYPDGGYFQIWEDRRNGASQPAQIYAQKHDAAGNRLWAENGVVISAGTNNQQFTYSSNQDYRNRRVAGSDGAGGLYITYTDDSVQNYVWKRICVQHIKPNGHPVFAGAGYIVARTTGGAIDNFSAPQLIADNDGGFYVAYIHAADVATDYVKIYNYRDEGGTMKLYGGGIVNQNVITLVAGNPCGGPKFDLSLPGTSVRDYNIWPDLQGNCSVAMSMYGNTASQGNMLCYNKVWKAKQEETVEITYLLADGSLRTDPNTYHKGDADVLYKARWNLTNSGCISGQNIYKWIDYSTISQGFQVVDAGDLPYFAVKGGTVTTGGNINAELITSVKRTLSGNTTSDPCTIAVGFMDEIYDVVPYQRGTNANPRLGYNMAKPAGLDTLSLFRDTLLAPAVTEYDFSLATGSNHAWVAGLMQEQLSDNAKHVRLQHLSVERIATGHYQFKYETSTKKGELIGRELNTGFAGTAIDYDFPMLTANNTGNALFYINEVGRYVRVSPVLTGGSLAWGAMGKTIGAPLEAGQFVSATYPFAAVDPSDGTGVIIWSDKRNLPASAQDIYMRHLDVLNTETYSPPGKPVKPFPAGSLIANPGVFTGVSKHYSTIEAYDNISGTLTPVVELLDDYNLGSVVVGIFENTGSVRLLNGKPYLDRNYTITPEHNPNGMAYINLRLYFTTSAFNALKQADPTINDPGSLAVIKQQNTDGTTPSAFMPAGSEIEISPVSWKAVDGGYYLEITVNSFSNFFIQKASSALPVKWLGIQANKKGNGEASVSWQVADQVDVKDYIVQRSSDGAAFTDQCTVAASSATSYSCTVPFGESETAYFRIKQRDLDGRYTFSKTVMIKPGNEITLSLSPNPVHNNLYVTVPIHNRKIQITDMYGRILQQHPVVVGVQSFDVSHLAAGMYIMIVKGDGVDKTITFIKE